MSEDARLRVAVIGCGHLGTYHARLYDGIAECELRGLVDIRRERAEQLGAELGSPAYGDLDELLARGEVDAVSIATPTVTHHDIACRCARAGLHALVEKPIAEHPHEGEEMIRLFREAGRVLAVGHVERFNPAFRCVRNEIGVPRFIESHRLAPFVPRSLDIDVVLDLMIHDLDLTLSLVASEIESLDAVGVPVLTRGEDIANARIRFRNGAVANLTASRVSRKKERKVRFFGPQAYHSLDLLAGSVEQVRLARLGDAAEFAREESHSRSDGGRIDPASAIRGGEESDTMAMLAVARKLGLQFRKIPVPAANALEDELRDFLGAARGAPLEGASGEAGLRSLEVAHAVRDRVRDSLERLGIDTPPIDDGPNEGPAATP